LNYSGPCGYLNHCSGDVILLHIFFATVAIDKTNHQFVTSFVIHEANVYLMTSCDTSDTKIA